MVKTRSRRCQRKLGLVTSEKENHGFTSGLAHHPDTRTHAQHTHLLAFSFCQQNALHVVVAPVIWSQSTWPSQWIALKPFSSREEVLSPMILWFWFWCNGCHGLALLLPLRTSLMRCSCGMCTLFRHWFE